MAKATKPSVKSYSEILGILSEQMEQLRPANNPNKEAVSAARASATVVNSYVGTIKLGMEYAKQNGRVADLTFLAVPVEQKSISEKAAA